MKVILYLTQDCWTDFTTLTELKIIKLRSSAELIFNHRLWEFPLNESDCQRVSDEKGLRWEEFNGAEIIYFESIFKLF